MSDYRQVITDIKEKRYAPVYILMGAEPFYIDDIMKKLEDSVVPEENREFDQSVFYGNEASAGLVLEASSMFPVLSEKRLVALKEAQSMTNAKNELDKFASYVSNPHPSTVLVLVYKGETLKASSEVIKKAKKNPDVVIVDSPKIKEKNLGYLIKDYCRAQKLSIEDFAIELLIDKIGSSLSNIFSSIDKLKLITGKDTNRISADLVHNFVGESKEYNVYELTSSLARKDYFASVNIIRHFESNPKAYPSVLTTGAIFGLFQRLALAAFSSDKSEKGLMEILQLKTPYALREINIGLKNYNATQIVKAISAIREFDAHSKGIGSMQNEYSLLMDLIFKILTLK